jgi:hypothetical protein
MDPDDARNRVRQLLLSGDNMLKNRTGPERIGRARARYEEALAIAREAGLAEAERIIGLRLAEVGAEDAGADAG